MIRILFVGGGTLGPVSPLLAIASDLSENKDFEIVGLVGTKNGPENELAKISGLNFFRVHSGKIRRYFDLRNIFAPFELFIGFVESLFLLARLKPSIVVSGGSFVGVPVVLAAWFLGIPSITHQQDVWPSLANKILVPFLKKISVVFSETLKYFPNKKTLLTGNPVRSQILSGERERGQKRFGLSSKLPTVLVFGGGIGAKRINDVLVSALDEILDFCQVIHVTGKGKGTGITKENYYQFELLESGLVMADAYSVSDLIICRAGIGTITELSALGKPAIIIPIPNTHQELNGKMLLDHAAAIYLDQNDLTSERMARAIKLVLEDENLRATLSRNIKEINNPKAIEKIVSLIVEVAKR